MKPTSDRKSFPTHTRRFLRWTQRLLFLTGSLALGYVAFTLLDARLYQMSAKRSLENQIEVARVQTVAQPRPAIKKGDVLGRMDIPRLGVSVAVLQGTNSRILRLGAGHIESTPLPGEPGNSGIAGHRDTFFRELKDIRKDDEIQLQTATGLLHYEVDWAKVIAPDDVSVLSPSTESALTLVTCYPFYLVGPAPKRFVVRAHQVLATSAALESVHF
ncbi:MAG: class D sortase [Candidatus Sulfotelmatobacter sp.]|jgi:sortase A